MADINRTDAEGLLSDQDIWEIVQDAEKSSAALQTFRRINMGTKTARMPVLNALPTAGFVTELGDSTGVKPTTEMTWGRLELTAEEIAVIVPLHENVFEDSEIGIWEEVRPKVAEEFGRVLDAAVFFGTNSPTTWPEGIAEAARTEGNNYVLDGTEGDLAAQINQVWGLVEADGHDVNVQYAARTLKSKLRGLRDNNGQPIYLASYRDDSRTDTVYGEDILYVANGAWQPAVDVSAATGPNTGATFIAGDRQKAILGMRSDMQVKVLDQATVGGLNLAERDMIALRFKMRVAFQVARPLMKETGATGYPFAILDTTDSTA